MAKLVARGTPVARMNTGIDGGMNKVFAAKLPDGNTGLSEGGDGGGGLSLALAKAPGTIPSHVNPPHAPDDPAFAVAAPAPTVAPNSVTRVASAAPNAPSDGFFSSLARKVGLGTADTTATTTPAPQPAAPAKPKVGDNKPPHLDTSAPKTTAPKTTDTRQAAAHPALKPSVTDTAATAAPAPAQTSMVAGAQPIVAPNSFDSRFSAAK